MAVDCVHSCYTTMTHRNWSMIEYVAEEVRWWLNELSEESNETRVAEHRDEEVFKVDVWRFYLILDFNVLKNSIM